MGWTMHEGLVMDIFEMCCKLPRIAGVYPYITRGTRIEVSKCLAFYNLVLAVSLVVFDAFNISHNNPSSADGYRCVTSIVRGAQLSMTSITISTSCIWMLRSRIKIQEMLDELMKFESIIKPENFKVCNQQLVGLVGFLTVLVITHLIVSPSVNIMMVIVNIRFHFATLMIFCNAAFFTRCARLIGSAYGVITDQLNDMRAHHPLMDIMKGMEHLVTASEALNNIFGPQMLFLTSTSFVLNTGNMYEAITSNDNITRLIAIIWVITFTKLMLHLIHSSNWTTVKAKELDKVLYRTVLEDKTGGLSQQVRMCLHFTNNRKVEFTACGFFVIDFALAGSMVAAATTYLVILIQIGGSGKTGN